MADLKGKRVLVTGGAGFIGSHIVDLLCDEGCTEIVALDNMVRGRPENLTHARANGPVRLVHGDIRDGRLMASLVKAADIVFHQAALRITHCAAEPRLAMEVMVQSTFDLLELCVKHEVEKVVAASSASVYGMAEDSPRRSASTHIITGRSMALRRRLMKGCFAPSTICMGLTTSHSDISMFMASAWTFMADTPRCSSAGWNDWRRARRRSFSAMVGKPWTLCTCAMLRAPTFWALRQTLAMKCSTLRAARKRVSRNWRSHLHR